MTLGYVKVTAKANWDTLLYLFLFLTPGCCPLHLFPNNQEEFSHVSFSCLYGSVFPHEAFCIMMLLSFGVPERTCSLQHVQHEFTKLHIFLLVL